MTPEMKKHFAAVKLELDAMSDERFFALLDSHREGEVASLLRGGWLDTAHEVYPTPTGSAWVSAGSTVAAPSIPRRNAQSFDYYTAHNDQFEFADSKNYKAREEACPSLIAA